MKTSANEKKMVGQKQEQRKGQVKFKKMFDRTDNH
jgi:hypothetical protein